MGDWSGACGMTVVVVGEGEGGGGEKTAAPFSRGWKEQKSGREKPGEIGETMRAA